MPPKPRVLPPVAVGIHIPKCAGITILEHVKSLIPINEIYQSTSIIDNFKENNLEFPNIVFKENLRFVWGHHVHDEMLKQLRRPLILFTGMREPIARMNSELNFLAQLRKHQGTPYDPADHLSRTKNPMCWFLINRFPKLTGTGTPAQRAFAVVRAFNWIYFSENFSESTAAIFKAMGLASPQGWKNVGERKIEFDIDPESFSHDIELYQRARDHFVNRDVEESLLTTTPQLQALLDQPVDQERTRNFLYGATLHEYTTWNMLDRVIEERQRQIAEMQAELAYYSNNNQK